MDKQEDGQKYREVLLMAEEIVRAMRCTTSMDASEFECENCKYRTLDKVNDEFPVPADTEIDGVKYWESCDSDRILLDAACMIEELSKKVSEHTCTKCRRFRQNGSCDLSIDMVTTCINNKLVFWESREE